MLYVFLVDSGVMMNFNMNIALESVLTLKKCIQSKFSIPIQKQVLLINGGELLDNDCKVCNYNGTGTDTSPIYLFNLSSLECPLPQNPAISPNLTNPQSSPNQQCLSSSPTSNININGNLLSNAPSSQFILSLHTQQIQEEQQIKMMKNKVQDSLTMEPSYETVVARTEISKQLRELTTHKLASCELLIRDQHLQHQGWRAVVANLEDLAYVFDSNVEKTLKLYRMFLEKKKFYLDLLSKINIDIEILDKIPVLDIFNEETKKNNQDLNEISEKNQNKFNISLLNWIHSQDTRFSLQNLVNNCLSAMEHYTKEGFDELNSKITQVKNSLKNDENKKIKRIEDRLYQLDELLVKAKKLSADQTLLTNGFIQNLNSASNIRDYSIYKDLCTSHQTQLKLILQNYIDLNSIKNRYLKAKHELIYSLHAKLKTIICIEEDLSNTNSTLVICTENLRKLIKNLNVLDQVHLAPKIYFMSINELLRRNLFTKSFRSWSSKLCSNCNQIYEKENKIRQNYQAQVSNHFLSTLFSGLNDNFPQFFYKEIPIFDKNLLELSREDLQKLNDSLHLIKEILNRHNDDEYLNNFNDLYINVDLLNENNLFDLIDCFNDKFVLSNKECANTSDCTSSNNQSESTEFEKIVNELDTGSDEKSIKDKLIKKQDSMEIATEAVEHSDILLNQKYKEIFENLKKEFETKKKDKELEITQIYDERIKKMNKDFEKKLEQELQKLDQKLKFDHKIELDSIRSRFKLACALDRSTMESSFKGEHLKKNVISDKNLNN